MTPAPNTGWQTELARKYFNRASLTVSPNSREVQVSFTNEADFLAATQAAYERGRLDGARRDLLGMSQLDAAKFEPMHTQVRLTLRAAEAKGWRGAAEWADDRRKIWLLNNQDKDLEYVAIIVADLESRATRLEKETPND